MGDRLPLNALRVFEAAARHGSFLKAAEELAITPGAVSRQVKALEIELSVRLFDRFNRAVRLTEAGETLATGARQGLAVLQGAVDGVRSAKDAPLVVTVLHSIAARWLVPRLHRFSALHPDVQVLIDASDQVVDLAREPADVAIRSGPGRYPGLHVSPLAVSELVVVCTPELAGAAPLRTPADLARVELLHDARRAPGEATWADWLAAAGVAEQVDAGRGARFSNTYLALEAVLAGRGAAIADRLTVVDDLASGRLVQPFPLTLPNGYDHWIVSLPEKAEAPRVRRFRRWLLAQAEADGLPRQVS